MEQLGYIYCIKKSDCFSWFSSKRFIKWLVRQWIRNSVDIREVNKDCGYKLLLQAISDSTYFFSAPLQKLV